MIVLSPSFAEKLASFQLGPQGIVMDVGGRRGGRGCGLLIAAFEMNRGRGDREHDKRHRPHARRGSRRDARRHQWNIVIGGRLIAGARRQKPPKLLLPLILGGGLLGALKALGPSLRGDGGGEVRELLGLEGEDLVARLGRLKRAGRRLARGDQRRHLRAVGVEIADDASLNAKSVLQGADRVLPALLSIGDQRLAGLAGVRGSVGRLERMVDLLDIVGNVLGLAQELLGALDRRLKLLQRGIRQAREIARLVDQHLRLRSAAT